MSVNHRNERRTSFYSNRTSRKRLPGLFQVPFRPAYLERFDRLREIYFCLARFSFGLVKQTQFEGSLAQNADCTD